jgi:hypothetical protein
LGCRESREKGGASRGASEGNTFYEKLWELNLKLEGVTQAFTGEDLGSKAIDEDFVSVMSDLESAFSKVVGLVRTKRGFPDVVPLYANDDVK